MARRAAPPPIASIVALMALLGDVFAGTSWAAWRAVLRALAALPLTADELSVFQRVTGRTQAPSSPFREAWFICGRRGGKSMIAALIAVYQTTCRTYNLAPGERGTFMVIAADRKQARTVKGYISGLLHAHPSLERLIAKDLDERIELTNGLVIEIHTHRSARCAAIPSSAPSVTRSRSGSPMKARILTARSSRHSGRRWRRSRMPSSCASPRRTRARAKSGKRISSTTGKTTARCWW